MRSKQLLLQKPPGTDGRLFPFARGSAFRSSLGSKNARYVPGVFRFERPAAEGVFIASLSREVSRLAATEGVLIASLLREVSKRSFDGRSFVSLSFLPRFFSPSLTPSVAYGASSLKREPNRGPRKNPQGFLGDRATGREPSSAPFRLVGREPPLASGERHQIPPRGIKYISRRLAFFSLCRMFAPMPPLCKGRGTACGGGIVGWARPIGKRRFFSFTIPQSAPLTAPFTQGSQTGETTSGREPFGTGDRLRRKESL